VPTQSELYERLEAAELDPELSWTEAELPERLRTKHVHRLHPYLGKFVPQLVEIFLKRYFEPAQRVLDPFAGCGTTLVEASTFGADSVGLDISAFNVLLTRAKTARYNPLVVQHDLGDALGRLERFVRARAGQLTFDPHLMDVPKETVPTSHYLRDWYDVRALAELLYYRSLLANYESGELMAVVLSRVARSARLTTHFRLDFPRKPQTQSYLCAKHQRICQPPREAYKFFRRYTFDAVKRVKEYVHLRSDAAAVAVHGDARSVDYGVTFDGLITSPPYPGRIDYHEQHRYAYELLGFVDRRTDEIGAAAKGTSKASVRAYVEDMVAVFENTRCHLRPRARAVIVVDDARGLYDTILREAGFVIDERRKRHVNRRTGRRNREYFEEIIVARR
jgi:hypothetical protein